MKRRIVAVVVSLTAFACGDQPMGNATSSGGRPTHEVDGGGAGGSGNVEAAGGGSTAAGSSGEASSYADASPDVLEARTEASIVCGKAEPAADLDPTVPPDPIAADSTAVTILNDGNVDEAATNVTLVSAGAGMSQGAAGASTVWKLKQPGAYLEYALKAVTAGTYAVNVVYFAAADGGTADVSLNGNKIGKVIFSSTDKAGGYGGIPNGLSRGPGTAASFLAGLNKIRIAFPARSSPVDVQGLQVNFSGHALSDAAKIQRLSDSAPTELPTDAPSDFYRINYDPTSRVWPAERSFCLVEYLVQTEKAGAYDLTMKYARPRGECSGVRFFVDGEAQAEQKLDPGAGVTAPHTIHLPCGVSRISVRNANYLMNGDYCAYGADYGEVDLKPLP